MAWLYGYGVVLVVCKIIRWDLDGTLEHEEWFKVGRRIVYKESVAGVGGFPFLLSLLVLLYSKESYDFETASTLVLCWFSRYELRVPFCLVVIAHFSFQYHLRPTLPVTYTTKHILTIHWGTLPCMLWSTLLHQQKIIPSGWNDSIRVDAVRQSRQRHPDGGLLLARRQYHALRCISPSHRSFTVSSRSVGLLF
jgi:hypothetical protein